MNKGMFKMDKMKKIKGVKTSKPKYIKIESPSTAFPTAKSLKANFKLKGKKGL